MDNLDLSIFDIVGPVMTGPSSSGTAGMLRIGRAARLFLNEEPSHVDIIFHERTMSHYEGCCSHIALLGGLMGFSPDDERLPDALSEAEKRGFTHTISSYPAGESKDMLRVKLYTRDAIGESHEFIAVSVGGGNIRTEQIDGFNVTIANYVPYLYVYAKDTALNDVKELLGKDCAVSENGDGLLFYLPVKQVSNETITSLRSTPGVIKVLDPGPFFEGGSSGNEPLFTEFKDLISICEKEGLRIWQVMLRYEAMRSGLSEAFIYRRMEGMWEICKKSVKEGLTGNYRPKYGLDDGRNGLRMLKAYNEGKTLTGGILPKVSAYALAVMEYASSMGCIMAAPTCGSSGVVPGCLTALYEEYGFSDEEIVKALLTMTSIGIVLAYDGVRFSGVACGCQGEITVGVAMAAMGTAYLGKASDKACGNAAAFAIKGLLGLVCDPVVGIEVPCIKRNVEGAASAIAAGDMAIAGIESFLSPDQASMALKSVQDNMPEAFRGGKCGCAAAAAF